MPKITRLDVEDAIRHAIQVEKDLRRFYEGAISLAGTAREREFLEGIFEDENAHKREFDRKYQEMTGHRLLYINVDRKRRLVEMDPTPAADKDLIQQAISNEEKAVQFYEQAAGLVPSSWLRQKFEEMAEAERRHVALLREFAAESDQDNGRARETEQALEADAA